MTHQTQVRINKLIKTQTVLQLIDRAKTINAWLFGRDAEIIIGHTLRRTEISLHSRFSSLEQELQWILLRIPTKAAQYAS